jgi:hypothetical protein
MTMNPITRSRLEAQGFYGLDDQTLAEAAPWMRYNYGMRGLASTTNFCIPSFIYNTVAAPRSRQGFNRG